MDGGCGLPQEKLLQISGTVKLLVFSQALNTDNTMTEHVVVSVKDGRYHGWPANNGIWSWGDEILVGFTQGDYVQQKGHSIDGDQENHLAKSLDGGQTWRAYRPKSYFRDDNPKYRGEGKEPLGAALNFRDPNLVVKVFSQGYHGTEDPVGGFFASKDRGDSWAGPYAFTGLYDGDLNGKILSARTAYLPQDENTCIFFISAKPPVDNENGNRVGCIQTRDGGRSFEFLSWVMPEDDKAVAIMPQTVQLSEDVFVLAYRKIYKNHDGDAAIEIYRSEDRCRTWQFASTVKITEPHSNPPALARLDDGRLCCAYGDRNDFKIKAQVSEDEGGTWGPEIVVRDDYYRCHDRDTDLGYVSMVKRPDGRLVSVYYWATEEHPEQYIAATIWEA